MLAACATDPVQKDPFGRFYDERTQIRESVLRDCTPSDIDTPPKVVRAIKPTHPVGEYYLEKRALVTTTFVVKPDGTTEVPAPKEGAGKWFLEHARIAISDWRLEPATRDGKPLAVTCKYTFVY
jgi:hypothetical protein